MQHQGQRLDQGNTMRINISNHFLTRHQRPPTGSNATLVVGSEGFIGSMLQGAPICTLIATSGIVRAAFLANDGPHVLSSMLGGLTSKGVISTFLSLLPPPISLLSFTPTNSMPSKGDTMADTVTVLCVTALLWWLGRPAERRWGPARYLTYLLVGYTASIAAFILGAALSGGFGVLTLSSSLWMVPAISLFSNNVYLSSRGNPQTAVLAFFSFRSVIGISLLSYALLLNVTGGSIGGTTSSPTAGSFASARFRSVQHSAPTQSLFGALFSLVPFAIFGISTFYLCSPSETYITHKEKGRKATGEDKPQLPPPLPEGSRGSSQPATAAQELLLTPAARMRSTVQRILYTSIAPRIVKPFLNRLVSIGSKKARTSTRRQEVPNDNVAVHQNDSAQHQQQIVSNHEVSQRNFKRRVITRIEDIGYTRAGTLMTDEEEVMYAAHLQGMMPALPHQLQRQQQQQQAAQPRPGAQNELGTSQPLTPEQQAKIQTLLEVGLPNVDNTKASHALASVGWDVDAAVTLLMEEMN